MSIQIEKVVTEQFCMRFFRFGTGERTFVILPGLSVQSVMNSADAIAAQYADMSKDFTIYVFDRREELPPNYSIYEMAADTAEAFRLLGLKEIDLFGASQGGMIAMVIAIEHPELISKLALGSTAARVNHDTGTVDNWIKLAQNNEPVDLYEDFGKMVYPKALFEQYRDILRETGKTVTSDDLARFIILAAGTNGFDVLDQLNRIACPVLVLGVSDDAVLGKQASEELIEALKDKPGFRAHIYEGYGHAAYDTAPDYRSRLMAFYLQ